MVVKYIAFDGSQFNSEQDCLEYERERTPEYALFGSDGRVGNLKEADLVIINSEYGAEQLKTIGNLEGCVYPGYPDVGVPGTWFWSNELNDFVRLNDSVPHMITKIQNGEWE